MREIPLTKGQVALVDDEDYEDVSRFHWHFSNGYAMGRIAGKGRQKVALHKHLMQPPLGMEVDHENLNRLDCQRGNMRLCTRSQNVANTIKRRGGTSRYKGVYWATRERAWLAAITVSYRVVHLGHFDNEADAALAYNRAAAAHFGPFARLNTISREVQP